MTAMIDKLDHYRSWIGKTDTREDLVAAYPVRAMMATLETGDPAPKIGDELPPYWHMFYFLEAAPASKIGPDGHPRRGGFLPPVELPRRMNAGNRIELIKPVRIGDTISREARVTDVQGKTGSSGAMVFVTVRNTISGKGGPAIVHEQDLVYRGDPAPDAKPATPKAAPTDATWSRTVTPDPVLLFRYSALVFVGHRIHYDLPYVTQVEGYPGLLVHGPLMGLMQLELARRETRGRRVARYEFRATSPVFHTAPFTVNARAEKDDTVTTWIANDQGALCQQGKVTFAT